MSETVVVVLTPRKQAEYHQKPTSGQVAITVRRNTGLGYCEYTCAEACVRDHPHEVCKAVLAEHSDAVRIATMIFDWTGQGFEDKVLHPNGKDS